MEPKPVFAPAKIVSHPGQGLTAVEKIFNANAVGVADGTILHAGSDARVKVNIVGSQNTTGPMTVQELEAMAATVISPVLDGAYQSGCHTASVWDVKAQANTPKLMAFMNKFGLVTGRDPQGVYHPMTDVIHKVLNDITIDDRAIIVGGDSHTRMSKGVAFGADSGTVALALATGQASIPVPESVKVTFKGKMGDHMDFRDVVHATQAQMLAQFDGENVFQGRIIEVHIGTLLADQAFTFTDWTAEMKAKASICISNDETLIESLEIAKSRIQVMMDKGMEIESGMLQSLIDKADQRIAEIRSGEQPALSPDGDAQYAAEVVVDLDEINEPMIADPDVDNLDVAKRYTHDTILPISFYEADKKVDLGFVGSCMVHKGDMSIIAKMFRNIEKSDGKVEFKAPLVVAPPTYNIVDELKAEGDWDILQKYAGFEFDDIFAQDRGTDGVRKHPLYRASGLQSLHGQPGKGCQGRYRHGDIDPSVPGQGCRGLRRKERRIPAGIDAGRGVVDHPRPNAEHRRIQVGGGRHHADEVRAAAELVTAGNLRPNKGASPEGPAQTPPERTPESSSAVHG